MKYRYFDAYDLRFIDELSSELRRSADTEKDFEAVRRRIFDLYLDGVQTREAILRALRSTQPIPATSPD